MIIAFAWFLLGFGGGCLATALEISGDEATTAMAQHAYRRVAQLRADADQRVFDVYCRWAAYMEPEVQAAYLRRLGM
ncbi:MAG: hypothetical protein HY825_16125 [Acidobacteria bacterium]|nr:hypothetical protein [Acidobacteriota bacterium]